MYKLKYKAAVEGSIPQRPGLHGAGRTQEVVLEADDCDVKKL
jgi:hypothetical protein